jgi:hypothetical protein
VAEVPYFRDLAVSRVDRCLDFPVDDVVVRGLFFVARTAFSVPAFLTDVVGDDITSPERVTTMTRTSETVDPLVGSIRDFARVGETDMINRPAR